MDRSELDRIDAVLGSITSVLLAVASGDFSARVPRSGTGDTIDVLAFLVNATVEEVAGLIGDLEREREELKRAHDQLVQAAKLAALGQLAGGVAHELNQPLTALRTLVDLLRERGEDKVVDHADDFEIMRKAVTRMGRIVDGVRTFARQSAFSLGRVEAVRPVDDALGLLGRQLRQEGIDVQRSVADELPAIHADGDRLAQVFVNLLANARDALVDAPDGRERRVVISVRADGGVVEYVVEDNGPGIDPAAAARVFDPFYTTKPPGKGTGLGLSVSRGIIEEHGGSLALEQRSGGGTRFVIRIPVESGTHER